MTEEKKEVKKDTEVSPEAKTEAKAEEKPAKEEENQQDDDDESESEKKDDPKLNDKGEYDGLRIKLKGFPLNRYVRDTNSLHKLVMDLFVTHLKCGVPKVKGPKITDRWLVLEMASNEDKKKVLTTIVNNYRWLTYRLTVRNCEKGAFTFRQPEVDDKGDGVELSEENVVDVLLKYNKMPYFQQLQTKSQDAKSCITEVLERLKTSEPHAASQVLKKQDLFEDIVPSPVIDGYSNDNFFSFVKDKETNKVLAGIMVHANGRSVLAPLEKCRQVPRQMMDVILDFTSKLDSLGLSIYESETKEGAIGGVGIQMNGSGEMLMSVYTAQSQESSFVPADVMRKKPNRKGDGKKEEAKKEEAKKDETKKEDAAKAKEEPKGGDEAKGGEETSEEKKEETEVVKEESAEKTDENKEDASQDDKKEDDKQYENETLDGGKLTFKKLKEAMSSFHEEVGKAMGVKSIYKGTILYSENGDLVEKLISFTFLAGVRSLKEVVNGVEFVLTPSRLLWPNARSFGILASVTERLAKICPSTVVVLACNDQRWLPTYFAKKCKEVLAISTWTTQTCQELLRTSHQKGIHNINYFNCNARIPPPVLKRPDRMVLVVWDHGDESSLKKIFGYNVTYETFIQVVTYTDKKKINRLAKAMSLAIHKMYKPIKVVPVDVKPLSQTVGVVAQYQTPKKNPNARNDRGQKALAKKQPPSSPFKGGRGGWSGSRRGGSRFFGSSRGPPPQKLEVVVGPSAEEMAVNYLAKQNAATRNLFETLVQSYVAPQQQDVYGQEGLYMDNLRDRPSARERSEADRRGRTWKGDEGRRERIEPRRRRSRSPPPRQRSREREPWARRESDPWDRRKSDSWDRRGEPSPPRQKPRHSPQFRREREQQPDRFSNDGPGFSRLPERPDPFKRSDRALSPRNEPFRRQPQLSPTRGDSFGRGVHVPRPVSPPRNDSRRVELPSRRAVSPRSDPFRRTGPPPPRAVSPPRRNLNQPTEMEPFGGSRFNNNNMGIGNAAPKDTYFLESVRSVGGGFKRPMSPEPPQSYEAPFKRQREGLGRVGGAVTRDPVPSFGGNYQKPRDGPGDRFLPSGPNDFSPRGSPPRRNFDPEPSFPPSGPTNAWPSPKPTYSETPFSNTHSRDTSFSSGSGPKRDWMSVQNTSEVRRSVWSEDQGRSELPTSRQMHWAGDSGSNVNNHQSGGGGWGAPQQPDDFRDSRRSFDSDVGRRSGGLPSQDYHQRPNTQFSAPIETSTSSSWYDQVVESQNSQENIFSRLGPSPRSNNDSMRGGWKSTY